ncbi:MAG TPA: hypothetical protein VFH73_27380 [Polyangia bacterium]|nr:hypothetical protein [Polyangia bacterium]
MSRHTPSLFVATIVALLILLPAGRATAQAPAPGSEVVTPLPPGNPPTAAPPPPAPEPPAPPIAVDAAAPPAERDPPFYKRQWFWGGLFVVGVTTLMIMAVSGGPGMPTTTLGNMRAN